MIVLFVESAKPRLKEPSGYSKRPSQNHVWLADYEECGIYKLCPSVEGHKIASRFLEVFVKHRRQLKRREYLYRAGGPFRAVFGIRSGSIKTCVVANDGRVQVIGFHIAGDLIGLNSIGADRYICDARALETTEVCEVFFDSLQQLAKEIPDIQTQMLRMLSEEILHNQELILLLGKKTAEERLAAFLLSLHSRFAKHAGPVDELILSMSRSDIGNYLGIAEETVSRVFTLFRQKGLIALRHRRIALRRPDKLSAIALN